MDLHLGAIPLRDVFRHVPRAERIRKESATRSGYPNRNDMVMGQNPGTQTVPYKIAD